MTKTRTSGYGRGTPNAQYAPPTKVYVGTPSSNSLFDPCAIGYDKTTKTPYIYIPGIGWQVLATSGSSGVLSVPDGGTGQSSFTAHGVLVGEGTAGLNVTSAGATGAVLTANTLADPSFQALGFNSGLSGLIVGNNNAAFTATTFLAPTAWTPNLQIGGSSTGITYSATPTGFYTQMGSVVFFSMNISLSSKGSNTGAVTVSNMPVAFGTNGGINNNIVAGFFSVTLTTNYTGITTFGSASGTVLNFVQIGSGEASANLTNTQLANTSTLDMNGFYLTN